VTELRPGTRLRLSPKTRLRQDAQSGKAMLVFPESVLVLNGTGGAIAELCDGRTIEEIVLTLAGRFGAPESRIRTDVATYVEQLMERGLLVLEPAQEPG
jgi:pyrroloquinoline quinone biosynthesis protein D